MCIRKPVEVIIYTTILTRRFIAKQLLASIVGLEIFRQREEASVLTESLSSLAASRHACLLVGCETVSVFDGG